MSPIRLSLTLAVLLGSGSLRAGGQPVDEERLVNVDSPHVVGLWKTRFDFQHAWSSGEVYSERLPVADLSLAFGLHPDVQLKVEGLFNNSEVRAGGQRATGDFSATEAEAQWRFLNQFAGAPVSAAVGAVYMHATYRFTFNGVVVSQGRYKTTGGKAILQKDFPRFSQTVEWKQVRLELVGPARDRDLYALQVGERIKVWQAPKTRYDLVADLTVAHKTDELKFKKAWGAGLQLVHGSPHTLTFFVGNTAGQTVSDSFWGYQDVFRAFRWSYRF